jgi:hypothetical protein
MTSPPPAEPQPGAGPEPVPHAPAAKAPVAPGGGASYAERLSVPPLWWVIPVFFVAALTWGFTLYLGPVAGAGICTAMVALVVGSLIAYGGLQIRVTADRFTAGGSWLPLSAVGAVYPLDEGQARALRGPRADARAYLVLRGYLPLAVRVDVDDPADRTPYWYVSTRHPQQLAAALTAARDRARADLKGGGS